MARTYSEKTTCRWPITVIIALCAISCVLTALLTGCAGGSRGTGSYGIGGVQPQYIFDEPEQKQPRKPGKSRKPATSPVSTTPTPSN